MKKIIALAIFLSLVVTGSAIAAQTIASVDQDGKTLQATASVNATIGKCSKGVRIGVTYESTAYSMITVHKSGSKYYGSSFDSTAIFVTAPAGDINASFTSNVPSTSVSATAFTSPWTAL